MGLTDCVGNHNFVVFHAFDYFGSFWVRDWRFMDFLILQDSIALPWCMGILSFGGLGVS